MNNPLSLTGARNRHQPDSNLLIAVANLGAAAHQTATSSAGIARRYFK